VIKNLCLARVSRFLDEQGDGNRGTGAGTKNFAAFPAGQFAGCPLISPQIEHIDGGKFFFQFMAETVRRVAVQPRAIGNKTENALVADAIRSPAEGPDIGIIQAVFVGGGGVGYISRFNACIQIRIFQILVVVVGVVLPYGIGRIADNDADIPAFLFFYALGIFRKANIYFPIILIHLKSIRQANAGKRLIRLSGHAVIGFLNVDCRNVIGQQHNFVGMQLIPIFQGQHVRRDESAFHHADGERPGSREGVKNMNALILEAATKVFLQRLVRTADNEIHHLNRRVDDAEAFHHLGKRRLEELVIQLHNELLPGGGVIDAFYPFPDAGVKAFQRIKVFFQSLPFQYVQNALHGLRNRIVFRKGVAFKQRIKNRFGNDMLRQHFNGLFPVNGRVQVAT